MEFCLRFLAFWLGKSHFAQEIQLMRQLLKVSRTEVVVKKKLGKYLIEYLWVAVGASLNAVALFCFINPANLVAGGFSGVSSVLSHVVCAIFPDADFSSMMSVFYFVLNLPFLVWSLISLRGDFTFKTIWSTVVCSVVLGILPQRMVFSSSRLVCVVFGGMLMGISMFICAINNGSNGGTEIIGKLVSKNHPERDMSNTITIANFATASFGCIVLMILKNESVWIVLYSLLFVVIGGEAMGILSRGADSSQKFLIVTDKYDEISTEILEKFGRGLTLFDVEDKDGQPSERKMIMVIVQYRQAPLLKQIIRKHDPSAFTFVKYVYDVFSRPGFNRSYKIK